MAIICEQCGKSLKSNTTLKNHIQAVHEKLRKHVCPICDKSFFDRGKLKFHQHKHSEVRNFHCDECGRSFKTRSDLYQHFEIHDKGKTFTCQDCGLVVAKRSTYEAHLKIHENSQKPFIGKSCKSCDKIYTSSSALRRHVAAVHEKLIRFTCPICSKGFVRKDRMKEHLNFHSRQERLKQGKDVEDSGNELEVENGEFSCLSCGKKYGNLKALTTHNMREHETLNKFQCDDCEESFFTRIDLTKHQQMTHGKNELHKCEECPETFQDTSFLYQHYRTIHQDKNKTFNCWQCGSEFRKRSSYDVHMRRLKDLGKCYNKTSLPVQEKKQFPCSSCSKWYTSLDSLKKHRKRVHELIKNHVCELCHSSFYDRTELVYHQSLKHSKKTSFVCEDCGQGFKIKSELYKHFETHDKGKTFSCSLCQLEFPKRSSYEMHLRRHEIIKSRTCEVCGDVSKNIKTFERHMRLAHGKEIKIYECDQCGRSFGRKSAIEEHMLVHGGARVLKSDKIFGRKRGRPRKIKMEESPILPRKSSNRNSENSEQIVVKCEIPYQSDTDESNIIQDPDDYQETQEFEELILQNFVKEEPEIKEEVLSDLSEDEILPDTNKDTKIEVDQLHLDLKVQENASIEEDLDDSEDQFDFIPKRKVGRPKVDKRLKSARKVKTKSEYSEQNYENGKKIFECAPCGNTYHSRQNLEDHQNAVHLKKMGFVCEICDLAFGWKRSLDRHNNSKHREGGKKKKKIKVAGVKLEGDDSIKEEVQDNDNEESTSKRKHMCPLCGNTYHSKQNMEDHQAAVHDKQRNFLCTICNISFAWRKSLKSHMDLKHGRPALTPGDTSLHCSFCEETFETRESIKSHCGLVHGKLIPVDCNFCQHSFTSKRTLRVHQVTIHGMVESAQFACGECDSVFTLKTSLSRHQIEKHQIRKDFKCEKCQEEFLRRRQLVKHIKVVHDGGAKVTRDCGVCFIKFTLASEFFAHISGHPDHFICPICGQNCEDEFALRLHKSTHRKVDEDEKKVVCDTCGLRFLQKSLLKIHLRQHSGEKCFTCDECGKSFKFQSNLCVHKKSHNKEFECSYCKRKCATRQALELHVNTHTGLKPYSCDVCDARFGAPNSLNIHKRKHTGEKKYKCSHCPTAFSFNSSLKNHILKQHGYQQIVYDDLPQRNSTIPAEMNLLFQN